MAKIKLNFISVMDPVEGLIGELKMDFISNDGTVKMVRAGKLSISDMENFNSDIQVEYGYDSFTSQSLNTPDNNYSYTLYEGTDAEISAKFDQAAIRASQINQTGYDLNIPSYSKLLPEWGSLHTQTGNTAIMNIANSIGLYSAAAPIQLNNWNAIGSSAALTTFSGVKSESALLSAAAIWESKKIAGIELTNFLNNHNGVATNWFTADGGAKVIISQWLQANMKKLMDGTIGADDALKDLAFTMGKAYLKDIPGLVFPQTIDIAKMMLRQTFKDGLDLGTDSANVAATSFEKALKDIYGQYIEQSQGWSSEQYANAGIMVFSKSLTEITTIWTLSKTLDIENFSDPGAGKALLALAGGLFDNANNGFNQKQWIELGMQVGTAYGGQAAQYITMFKPVIDGLINGYNSDEWIKATAKQLGIGENSIFEGITEGYDRHEWLDLAYQKAMQAMTQAITNALSPILTPFGAELVAMLVNKVVDSVVNSIFGSKHYYENEFSNAKAALNSVYQVQQIDDGTGHMVSALVATSANGSTIIAKGITTILGGTGQDVLVGNNSANDVIMGKGGSDYLEGRSGNDTLVGEDGTDHVAGGDGNDFLSGGAGDDVMFGDAGNDTVLGDNGDNFLHLGSGNDVASTGDGNDIVMGGLGNDVIDSGAGNDIVESGAGNDAVTAGDGNDVILANLGDDNIKLGSGNDIAFGDNGDDSLYGESGDDTLSGGLGIDIIEGGDGNDILLGEEANDYINGDLGNDNLLGGDGNDVLVGGLGSDFLSGDAGNDSLVAGDGDDVLIGGAGVNTMSGSAGNDIFVITNDATDSNNSIIDTAGNDTILLSGLDEANLSGLKLLKNGNDLVIFYDDQALATLVDQFNGKAIETLEINNGKILGLTNLVFGSDNNAILPTFQNAGSNSAALKLDAKLSAIDTALLAQSQVYNNALIQNVAEAGYNESLKDELEHEQYNMEQLTSFKRKRGHFGGHYNVFTFKRDGSLDGTNEVLALKELPAGFDINSPEASNYNRVIADTTKVTNSYQVSYRPSPIAALQTATVTVIDYYEGSTRIATDIQSSRNDLAFSEGENGDITFVSWSSGLWRVQSSYTTYTAEQRTLSGQTSHLPVGLEVLDSGSDKIVGAWWAEVIQGQSGSDVLIGNGGNDSLDGGTGNDWIFGGDGLDTLIGGVGYDVIMGNNGNDYLQGDADNDAILGNEGNDVVAGVEGNDWINGGAGNDKLDAGIGDDVILGGTGDDKIYGWAGKDYMEGNDGNDLIEAGEGDDVAFGGDGNDTILGLLGNDNIAGNEGNDTLNGGDGNDTIFGSIGDDSIVGDAGADSIDGGEGKDIVSYVAATGAIIINLATNVNTGNIAQGDILNNIELVVGSQYADQLTGDNNNNIFQGWLGADTIDGGAGIDTALYESTDIAHNINLATGTNSGGSAQGDVLINIENVIASYLHDTVTGSNVANYLAGLAGNDILSGGLGDDTLEGGSGADTMDGGDGIDAASYNSATAAVTVNLANNSFTGNDAASDVLTNIENIIGSRYNDSLYGNAINNRIEGGEGQDTIRGYDGNDTLYGGAANDNIGGGNGNDLLDGETGNDSLMGEAGADNIYGNTGDDTLEGGDSNDTISGGDGHDLLAGGLGADSLDGGLGTDVASYASDTIGITVNLGVLTAQAGNTASEAYGDILVNIENVTGGTGNDNITGSSGANSLVGGAGEDTVLGGNDDDTIYGGIGNDSIDGNEGNDSLFGDAGNDVLKGAEGNDTLNGGDGNDTNLGGIGDDWILGNLGADSLDGGDGKDVASYVDATGAIVINLATNVNTGNIAQGDILTNIEVVVGSQYADRLTGDDNNNTFLGWLGADTIDGGAGNDTVLYESMTAAHNINLLTGTGSGGAAQGDVLINVENVVASYFNDTVTGSNVANYLTGLDGNDILSGGYGDDTLEGGLGADTLNGGDGFDAVSYSRSTSAVTVNLANNGFAGNDAIGDVYESIELVIGSNYNDSLSGNAANNQFGGGEGDDTIRGYDGNDAIWGAVGNDNIWGGNGNDLLDGETGNDSLIGEAGADTLYGSAGNDTLEGGDDNDSLDGGIDADVLNGGIGNDTLLGSDGNDTLIGGAGADNLNGGAGTDTASYASDTVGVTVNLTLTGAQAGNSTSEAYGDVLTLIENVTGGFGNDSILGTSSANLFYGNGGNDTLNAANGNDTVYGGLGNDSIIGDGGNDVLYGEDGNDTMDGGVGSDTLDGGIGNDSLSGYTSADSLSGGDGDDTLVGGSNADTLNGGAGTDTASYAGDAVGIVVDMALTTAQGGSSDATGDILISIENVIGGSGNDSIKGDGNANSLIGNAGNDTLMGGLGADSLTGGLGLDVFQYNVAGQSSAATSDLITDFAVADDKIDLSGLGINSFSQLQIISSGGVTTVSSSVGGFSVMLTGTLTLTASNFIFAAAPANTAPVATADSYNLNSGATLNIAANGVLANDTDAEGNSLAAILVSNVANGTLTLNSNGSFSYTHNGSANLTDSFTYKVNDGTVDGNTVTVTLNMTATNQTLTGDENANTLSGAAGNDSISGLGGNDLLTGLSGNDTILGGDGNDTLIGGIGADSLDGGAGTDMASYASDTVGVTVNLTLTGAQGGNAASEAYGDVLTLVENVTGGSGNDSVLGTSSANLFYGNGGNDTLNGASGNDTIYAGIGNDTLIGDGGNDVLYGEDGNDSIDGGVGFDTIYGGVGTDYIIGYTSADSLVGGDDNDTLNGGSSSDTLDGGNGIDTATYQGDTVGITLDLTLTIAQTSTGEASGDVLSSIENVIGGSGNDSITGNASANSFTGGAGGDVFKFLALTHSTDTARDNIVDFVHLTDKLNLAGLGFTGIQSGASSGTVLGYSVVNGHTIIDAANSDFSIDLTGSITLTNDDFIFS